MNINSLYEVMNEGVGKAIYGGIRGLGSGSVIGTSRYLKEIWKKNPENKMRAPTKVIYTGASTVMAPIFGLGTAIRGAKAGWRNEDVKKAIKDMNDFDGAVTREAIIKHAHRTNAPLDKIFYRK